MTLKSRRVKGIVICASILISVLLLFGVCLASASAWNPSADFSPQNGLYTLLNALKTADRTAVYSETPRARLRDRVFQASHSCAAAYSNLKLFESRSGIVLYAGIAGTIFEKPEPRGADMVSRE